jgi:hypothetical protein
VNDLGKIGVIAGIMGAILLMGLLLAPTERVAEPVQPVEDVAVTKVTVLEQETLEMLDPIYSEKAVFQDETIRIAFDTTYAEEGVESRLSFWIHNVSDNVINILWDRCSMQLPCGNTVKIINEERLHSPVPPERTISIAPAGDLFDAVIPVSEFHWNAEEEGWSVSTSVLDDGTFTLVLGIERGAPRPKLADPCEEPARGPGREPAGQQQPAERQIVYYTFRFVVR